jgi:hypothetical protein
MVSRVAFMFAMSLSAGWMLGQIMMRDTKKQVRNLRPVSWKDHRKFQQAYLTMPISWN